MSEVVRHRTVLSVFRLHVGDTVIFIDSPRYVKGGFILLEVSENCSRQYPNGKRLIEHSRKDDYRYFDNADFCFTGLFNSKIIDCWSYAYNLYIVKEGTLIRVTDLYR